MLIQPGIDIDIEIDIEQSRAEPSRAEQKDCRHVSSSIGFLSSRTGHRTPDTEEPTDSETLQTDSCKQGAPREGSAVRTN